MKAVTFVMPARVPLPKKGLGQDSPPQLAGMLHVPINTILAGNAAWRRNLGLPDSTGKDWAIISRIDKKFKQLAKRTNSPFPHDYPGVIALSDTRPKLNETISKLSFMPYLKNRLFREVELYQKYGVEIMELENVGAPYFHREQTPMIIPLTMNYLATLTREAYPDLPLGVQVLCNAENFALEIAIANGCFYVRGESLIFNGLRPEGYTNNLGNLAKAYYMRERFNALLSKDPQYPLLFVDLKKKHTHYPAELSELGPWLDNIGFQKLEGAIITGKETGAAVDPEDLVQAREKVFKLFEATKKRNPDAPIDVPVISGSGATPQNMAVYKESANLIIIGSFPKKHGYWEEELNEGNLKNLVEAFNKSWV